MAETESSTYVYTPLKPGEIRLLFADSTRPDELTWSLRPVSLLESHQSSGRVEFDALSYAWGDQRHAFPFRLSDSREIWIHENLNKALPCLARRRMPLPIWIDAICINQSDEAEKSLRIRLMHKIYRSASHVIVWLGHATTYTEQAIAFFPVIARVGEELKATTGTVSETLESRGLPEWFTRLWILQEAALATSIKCLCGDFEIDWQILEQAAGLAGFQLNRLFTKIEEATHLPSHSSVFLIRNLHQDHERPSSQPKETDAFHLLHITHLSTIGHNCSSARDRVYGLLGFARDEQIKTLNLYDIELPVTELFIRFMHFLLHNVEPTRLGFWGLISIATAPNKMDGLPSWCPDLHNQEPETRDFDFSSFIRTAEHADTPYNAGRSGLDWARKGLRQEELGLRGVVFDRIVDIYPSSPINIDTLSSTDFETFIEGFRSFLSWERSLALSILGRTASTPAPEDSSQPLSQISIDNYFQTLCAGKMNRHQNENIDTARLHEFRYAMDGLYDAASRVMSLHERDRTTLYGNLRKDNTTKFRIEISAKDSAGFAMTYLLNRACKELYGRRVFKTFSGRFGLAHEPIQNGDVLCVLDSAPTPHVLRRSLATQEEKYILISEAYMNGMMNGEVYELGIERQDITLL